MQMLAKNNSTVLNCATNLIAEGSLAHPHDLLKSTHVHLLSTLFWLLSQLVLSADSFSH